MVWSAPSHYLTQCWNSVYSNPRNRHQWNLKRNSLFSFKKMHLKMSSAKWQNFCFGRNIFKQNTSFFGTWNRCHGTGMAEALVISRCHGDVIKWKPFPRYWPFVRGNHRSPVDSPHKHQILRRFERHLAHYDVIVMVSFERTNTSAKRALLLFSVELQLLAFF